MCELGELYCFTSQDFLCHLTEKTTAPNMDIEANPHAMKATAVVCIEAESMPNAELTKVDDSTK